MTNTIARKTRLYHLLVGAQNLRFPRFFCCINIQKSQQTIPDWVKLTFFLVCNSFYSCWLFKDSTSSIEGNCNTLIWACKRSGMGGGGGGLRILAGYWHIEPVPIHCRLPKFCWNLWFLGSRVAFTFKGYSQLFPIEGWTSHLFVDCLAIVAA